jgi:hypothetical protein
VDERRKRAYRHLLYQAMLDIRPLGWYRFWTPLGWWRQRQHIVRAGVIADWLHNLAQHSAYNFEHFDEARFWHDFDYALRRCPNSGLERYRERFEAMTGPN